MSGLPYITVPPIDIGIELQPFGILVATGVLVGAWLLRRYGEKINLNDDHMRGLIMWVLVGGFIGAHVFDVLAYQWDRLLEDPLLLVKVWAGISSYGGFIGGFLGFFLYCRKYKLPLGAYADATGYGLLPGFTFGRLGCTLVHDHIGQATDFALGVNYPSKVAVAHGMSGASRMHNLGMYEFMYLLPVCAIIFFLATRPRRPHGMLAVTIGALYAPVRFFLDGLRLSQSDPRYAGLTFAQWMSIVVTAVSVYGIFYVYRSTRNAPETRGARLATVDGPFDGAAAKAKKPSAAGAKPSAKKKQK